MTIPFSMDLTKIENKICDYLQAATSRQLRPEALQQLLDLKIYALAKKETNPLNRMRLEYYASVVDYFHRVSTALNKARLVQNGEEVPGHPTYKESFIGSKARKECLKDIILKINTIKITYPKDWLELCQKPALQQTMLLWFMTNIRNGDDGDMLAQCEPWITDLSLALGSPETNFGIDTTISVEDTLKYLIVLMKINKNDGEMESYDKDARPAIFLEEIRLTFNQLIYKTPNELEKDMDPSENGDLIYHPKLPSYLVALIKIDFACLMMKAMAFKKNLPILLNFTHLLSSKGYFPDSPKDKALQGKLFSWVFTKRHASKSLFASAINSGTPE